MKRTLHIHGAISWSGTFKGMPAVIGTWYSGSALFVYKDGEWYTYALSDELIVVKECKCCGTTLPIENQFDKE